MLKRDMKIGIILILFLGLFFGQAYSVTESQQLLSEEALFHRCYLQFTRQSPDPNNQKLKKVQDGSLGAIDACMALITESELNPTTGLVPSLLNQESINTLNTFYQLHTQWFMAKDFDGKPQTYSNGELRHNDQTEPALLLTGLLFGKNTEYKEIVTGDYSVRGIRSLGPYVTIYKTGSDEIKSLTNPNTGLYRGILQGVKKIDPAYNNVWFTDNGTQISTHQENYTGAMFESKRNWGGGGILGLQSYQWMNSGYPTGGAKADGGIRTHRRLANNFFKDLMCRDLPVLRTVDVSAMVDQYIVTYPDESKRLPFRQNSTCMSCHATADNFGNVFRALNFPGANGVDWDSTGAIEDPQDRLAIARLYPITQPPETLAAHLISSDTKFFQRPASGTLRFRSYDGTFNEYAITGSSTDPADGIKQLGVLLSQSKDLYVCAAAKYFEYFTGVGINLNDEGDPRNIVTDDDKYYRSKVEQMGLNLMNHQDVKTLIREILNSETYKKTGLRDLSI